MSKQDSMLAWLDAKNADTYLNITDMQMEQPTSTNILWIRSRFWKSENVYDHDKTGSYCFGADQISISKKSYPHISYWYAVTIFQSFWQKVCEHFECNSNETRSCLSCLRWKSSSRMSMNKEYKSNEQFYFKWQVFIIRLKILYHKRSFIDRYKVNSTIISLLLFVSRQGSHIWAAAALVGRVKFYGDISLAIEVYWMMRDEIQKNI